MTGYGGMMTIRGLGASALVVAVLVSGCTTLSSARDRIVKREARCQDMTIQVYFEPDSAEVTDEGRAVMRAAADRARVCRVDQVTVMGLADAAGAAGANLELSQRRAASVTQALTAFGLPAAEFDLTAVGQAGAITAGGDTRPLRRRADVVLKLSAPR